MQLAEFDRSRPLCEWDDWDILIEPEFYDQIQAWFGGRFFSIYLYRMIPLGFMAEVLNRMPDGEDWDDRAILQEIKKDLAMKEHLEHYVAALSTALSIPCPNRKSFLEGYDRAILKHLLPPHR